MWFHNLIQAVENKYNRLLMILIGIYLSSPFLVDQSIGNLIVFLGFLGAIIIVVYQIQCSRKTFRLQASLVGLALLLKVLSYVSYPPLHFDRLFAIVSNIILLVFLVFSVYWILRELTLTDQVTEDIVKGGICVYFLFGFLWAGVYELVYTFDPHSFHAVSLPLTRGDLTHFSFTTLTTVGYGDISPVSKIARVLANLEGMVGVMYPTVFIARLVSLHSTR
ncbi:MAG TPA: potassium channel family protein [Allocoleopsis sp.]